MYLILDFQYLSISGFSICSKVCCQLWHAIQFCNWRFSHSLSLSLYSCAATAEAAVATRFQISTCLHSAALLSCLLAHSRASSWFFRVSIWCLMNSKFVWRMEIIWDAWVEEQSPAPFYVIKIIVIGLACRNHWSMEIPDSTEDKPYTKWGQKWLKASSRMIKMGSISHLPRERDFLWLIHEH